MPLTLSELEDLQAEALADDVEIDFDKMSLWDEDTAREYFENGGVEPVPAWTLPPAPEQLKQADPAEFKKWFPRYQKQNKPAFRMVCFHSAGSAESMFSGRGVRQPKDNPFVLHCQNNGGELLACELPGREQRRNDQRYTKLSDAAAGLYPVLAPLLQDGVPYVLVAHSMGTWVLFETMKLLMLRGIPLPTKIIVSAFPAPYIPVTERPWRVNKPMNDTQFKEECRTWNVNEIVFSEGTWKIYEPLMRDDFTFFDSFDYVAAPAAFPVPIDSFYAVDDKNVKSKHTALWQQMTSKAFTMNQVPGHHLFFYDYKVRNDWMDVVCKNLPF